MRAEGSAAPGAAASKSTAGSTMVLSRFDRRGAEDEATSVAGAESLQDEVPGAADETCAIRVPVPNAHSLTLRSQDADTVRDADETQAIGAVRDADETQVIGPAQLDTARLDAAQLDAARVDAARPDAVQLDQTEEAPRLEERTMLLGAVGVPLAGVSSAGEPPMDVSPVPGEEVEELSEAMYGTRWRGWRRTGLAALAVFLLAMAVVTGTELATGHDAAGGKGTSVGNVFRSGGSREVTPSTPATPSPGAASEGTDSGGATDEPTGRPEATDGGTTDSSDTGSDADAGSDTGSGSDADSGTADPTSTPTPTPTLTDGGATKEPTAPSSSGSATHDSSTGTRSGGDVGDTVTGGLQAPDPESS